MSTTATTLHNVVVTNEQTRVRWRAGHASIDNGFIVVVAADDSPPPGLLDRTASTFTITAVDAGGRSRCFQNVTVDAGASAPPKKFAFT
ncbi:MAG TPA: hypothetical protein VGF28_10085 [Thermoanaerobaculia bacterium]|jgi:hypothetical protein